MYQDIECDWVLVTAPAQEPISLDEAKLHAGIVQDDDNLLTAAYLKAARLSCESYLGRGLFTQTMRAQFSAFADILWLPLAAPLQNDPNANPSTAPVVQYYDDAGVLQTLATSYYVVDTTSTPGRIVRAPNQTWPSVQGDRLAGSVVVTYVVGWTSVDDIPEDIKQGIRVYVAGFDGNRVDVVSEKAARACWLGAGQVFWRPPAWRCQ
jgi:uncharacterized phiE125 gp8 family phage protein